MNTKEHTTQIDNAFNIPKRDKDQPKQLFTNSKTNKQYLAHPYFEPMQYFDNLITVTYRTTDSKFKVPTNLSQKTIVDLHSAINDLPDSDRVLAYVPTGKYTLDTSDMNKPNVHTLEDDNGDPTGEYLVYATYKTAKSPTRLGISI